VYLLIWQGNLVQIHKSDSSLMHALDALPRYDVGMKDTSLLTHSLWLDSETIKRRQPLSGDLDVDVAIIGAGITGITCAELLSRQGLRIGVLDQGRIGHGETGHTTAHLTEVQDISFQELISNFGVEGGRLACQALRRSIQLIESNVEAYSIDCDFKRLSCFQFAEKRDEVAELEKEAEAALALSIPADFFQTAPLPFEITAALRYDHQAQFHPLKYIHALADQAEQRSAQIFEQTRVLDVEQDGPQYVVKTDFGVVRCPHLVVAANVPILSKFSFFTKIAAYRSYAIAFELDSGQMDEALFYDLVDPYHYIRRQKIAQKDFVIVGGEDHKTGQDDHTAVHFDRLEGWCRARFSFGPVTHRWSGQIINPVDGLPYIGRSATDENIFVATGFSGLGMTFGTVSAMLISDLIQKEANPWSDLFSATRVKPLASFRNYVSENVDFPSHLIRDRVTPAEENDLASLRENEGALVRVGAKKVAAYRDPEGQTHLLSPVCPHLGCYVHWNDAEKSWDCPCHGSRFDPLGKVLNGPAMSDLKSEVAEDHNRYATENYETPPSPTPFVNPLLTFRSCPLK